MALTATQIQNMARTGQLDATSLEAAYSTNNIPFPARVPYAQLAAQAMGVENPNADGQSTSVQTGGYSAPTGPTRAQTDPLLASLATLDTILQNKDAQTDEEYNKAISGYNEQDALDKASYDENVFNNENTLTKNNQAAMLNAANGASGLRGVLSSLGGLAGSGIDVIKRLVGLAANSDTGAARQTFDTNATNLTQAWGQAEQQQRQRREDAKATMMNNKQNNRAGVLTSRQSIYQQLANLYGAGDATGNEYASKASALSAPIAETTRATVAPYATASSSFSPAALKSYLAGTQNLNASASGDITPINSPVFANSKKKDTLNGVA